MDGRGMIKDKLFLNTKDVLNKLYDRQGGALIFNTVVNNVLDLDTNNWKILSNLPKEYKEFSISIYNVKNNEDKAKLILFINPKELVIAQSHKFSNSYTRKGWVNTAWGNQQISITISGVSPAFYFIMDGKGGITNYFRRRSASFINLMDLIGLYKNNGWYFLNGITNNNLFKDGYSRVINVMDQIKIEYDGSTYIGSFSTFSLTDAAESPYKIEYNFEFIVSSLGIDLQGIEGHLAIDDNFRDDEVHVAIQGYDIDFKPIIGLDTEELNRYFPIEERTDFKLYDYTDTEEKDERVFYTKEGVVVVPEGVFRITRGWRDAEDHGGKCDFRTHTGTIYSATNGEVVLVTKSYYYGGSNYVLVKSEYKGDPIYVRYFHLDPDSIRVKKGDSVEIGTVIGREGTDGGKYPPHCDFCVRKICGNNTNFLDCPKIEATPILDNMWLVLHERAKNDLDYALDFTKLITKHPLPGKDITNLIKGNLSL
jgi:murein DD-endopeptidase MepM/ murein hydrolase activator NlpD